MSWLRRGLTGTNYCGPGGEGEPIGELDAACKEHDEAYTAPYLFDYVANQEADKMFLQRLRSARTSGIRQRVTKYVAQRYFGAKTSLISLMSGEIRDPNQGQVVLGVKKRKQAPIARYMKRRLAVRGAVPPPPLPRNRIPIPPPAPPVRWRHIVTPLPYYRGRHRYARKTRRYFRSWILRRSRRYRRNRRS